MKWLAIAVLLLTLVPPQAKAFGTTMDLLEYCEAEDGDPKNLACVSYLRGYIDHTVLAQVYGNASEDVGCVPFVVGATAKQVRLMIIKSAKEHPELLSHRPAVFINLSLIHI